MLGAALLVAVTTIVYLPALRGKFILDDILLLTNNDLIKSSSGLHDFWFSIEPPDYWPLTSTTFWIEWRLWKNNPIGYHITNLVLHIASSLLLWMTLKKLRIPGAFLAAMIFAIHPINVQSVAWISQRKNVLAMLFFLLAIFWFVKNEIEFKSRLGAWYWLSLFAFLLALLSKGSVAILPALLLLIIWRRREILLEDVLRIIPFFVIAILLVAVNIWFQSHGVNLGARDANFVERLIGAAAIVWFYFYKTLLPIHLMFVYPQWQIELNRLIWWLPLAAAIIVTIALWIFRDRGGRPFLFAWAWFCIALIPVMGFTDVGWMNFALVADHYQYIAIIGIVALAAAGWNNWFTHRPMESLIAAVIIVVILSILTFRQSKFYRSAEIIYRHTLAQNPTSWMLENNLGFELFDTNRDRESVIHYNHALQLKPNYPQAEKNLAVALKTFAPTDAKELDDAISRFNEAVITQFDLPEAYLHLADAYALGGDFSDAIDQAQNALALARFDKQNELAEKIEIKLNNYRARRNSSSSG
jgi:tetratricopeptide (TPR) repeat protein